MCGSAALGHGSPCVYHGQDRHGTSGSSKAVWKSQKNRSWINFGINKLLYGVFPKNQGTFKSSILIGFSTINHPFWGTPIVGNTHITERSWSLRTSFHPKLTDSIKVWYLDLECYHVLSSSASISPGEEEQNGIACLVDPIRVRIAS